MKKLFLLISLFALISLNYSCSNDDDSNCICTEEFDPVCGDDGVEYGNACKADCAGVTYTEGFCTVEMEALVVDKGPIAADGCGWVIQFMVNDEMTDHYAEDLPDLFKQDGIEVKITYQPTMENFTCGLMPINIPEIDLLSIEEL